MKKKQSNLTAFKQRQQHTSGEPGAIPIKTNHFSEGSHL